MIKTNSIQHIDVLKNLLPNKKLLIVGKGPSVENWKDEYLKEYNSIGLNDVADKLKIEISHYSDYDTFLKQKKHPKYVIVSAFMNYENKTIIDLKDVVNTNENLKNLNKENRLFSYDIETIDGKITNLFNNKNKPFIFKFASGVLAIQIAIHWKLKEVFTLGIDGGQKYHPDFEKTKGNGLFLDNQIQIINDLAKSNKLNVIKI